MTTIKKIPKYRTPYLKHRYDRIDEYHTLDSDISEEEFATWWAVVFGKGKIKTLEDALSLPKYKLNYITRENEDGYYGNWVVDLYGGFFGCMGLYFTSDFYMPWFPRKELCKGTEKNLKVKRFEYIQSLIKKYFD